MNLSTDTIFSDGRLIICNLHQEEPKLDLRVYCYNQTTAKMELTFTGQLSDTSGSVRMHPDRNFVEIQGPQRCSPDVNNELLYLIAWPISPDKPTQTLVSALAVNATTGTATERWRGLVGNFARLSVPLKAKTTSEFIIEHNDDVDDALLQPLKTFSTFDTSTAQLKFVRSSIIPNQTHAIDRSASEYARRMSISISTEIVLQNEDGTWKGDDDEHRRITTLQISYLRSQTSLKRILKLDKDVEVYYFHLFGDYAVVMGYPSDLNEFPNDNGIRVFKWTSQPFDCYNGSHS
jgi:hypothetical protein